MLAKSAILGGLVATILVGCWHGDTTRKLDVAACEGSDSPASYRTKGKALVGDVNADGTGDRVTLRVKEDRPARCRHLLVVQITGGGTAVEPLPPLAWPGTDPQLLLLAQVDGRPGLEPVVAMSSAAAVYRPGAVFTLRHGKLLQMQLERMPVPELFPLDDEFPAGVDCAGRPGTIVVTQSRIAAGGDTHWDVTRTFYRVAEARFGFVRIERFKLEVGSAAGQRWPEVRGAPFSRCPERVS